MLRVRTIQRIHKRQDASRRNEPISIIEAGTILEVEGPVKGEKILGKADWFRDIAGFFYWGGALKQIVGETITDSLSAATTSHDIASVSFDYNKLIRNLPAEIRNSRGKGVKIAVLDSGIFQNHPDFIGLFNDASITSVDFTGSPAGFNDKRGHGTHVAGLIGARNDDPVGITGVAPESTLINIKVLKDSGSSSGQRLKAGLEEALRQDADIINLSLSITEDEFENVKDLLVEIKNKGKLVIASAGNNDTLVSDFILFPAMSSSVISVGAISKEFIEVNRSPSFNSRLDFILPEIDFFSCSPKEFSFYKKMNGSSMNTAIVTGIVALLIGAMRSNKPNTIIDRLHSLAKPFDASANLDEIVLMRPG
jgi:subtilisin family serine protease